MLGDVRLDLSGQGALADGGAYIGKQESINKVAGTYSEPPKMQLNVGRDSAKVVLSGLVKRQLESKLTPSPEEVLLKVIPWDLLSKQDENVLYELFKSVQPR